MNTLKFYLLVRGKITETVIAQSIKKGRNIFYDRLCKMFLLFKQHNTYIPFYTSTEDYSHVMSYSHGIWEVNCRINRNVKVMLKLYEHMWWILGFKD